MSIEKDGSESRWLEYKDKHDWVDVKPRWYECVIKIKHLGQYEDIVNWIYDHIDNCEQHARWTHIGMNLHVRFRYERDYMWCRLVWE